MQKHTFALRGKLIFLTLCSYISPEFYTANLENHSDCIFILVELQRNQSFRYIVTGIEYWVKNG